MAEPVTHLKPPPHSADSELSLVGTLLLHPDAWPKVESRVEPADFYRTDARVLFSAIKAMHGEDKPADHVAVVDALMRSGKIDEAGGLEHVAKLIESVASAVNVGAYADRIRQYAQLRELHQFLGNTMRGVLESAGEDIANVVARTAEGLLRFQAETRSGRGLVGSSDLMIALIDELDRRAHGERGLSIGLSDFDELSFGLEPGDLAVFAGRPGVGKTALLVSIAAHVSRDAAVAVFSAEMSASQLMRRCVSLLGRVSQGHLRRADLLTDEEWRGISEAATALMRRHLLIDDTPAPQLSHIRAETLAQAARAPLGLVLVDYVQLVQGSGENRYAQLRDVSYGLKGLAKEARVPIILLAQLNRGVEARGGNKRGRLADLRDSGAIEEAADMVGMLYSEGYYDDEFPMPNVLECSVEKNRNGERGRCFWHFAGEYSRIGVLDPSGRKEYLGLMASKRGGRDDDL